MDEGIVFVVTMCFIIGLCAGAGLKAFFNRRKKK